jgi:cell division protease FtsH
MSSGGNPRGPRKEDGDKKAWSPPWIWIVAGLLLMFVIWGPANRRATDADFSYTRFRHELDRGNVASLTVEGNHITGRLKEPVSVSVSVAGASGAENESAPSAKGSEAEPQTPKPRKVQTFSTYYPVFGDEDLMAAIRSHDVTLSVNSDSGAGWWALAMSFGPFLLLLVVLYFFSRGIRSAGRGVFSIGRNRARLYDRRREDTTFDDVAGSAEAKAELMEIVQFLEEPARVGRLGGEMPKGVLLVGPPGTGKTLLARAVAGEAQVPFFSMSGSDFMELFVGVGASRVRDLFKNAKASAPSIIFIDELDSVARRRGSGLGGGHDEREQTLNQLLSEMDGFVPNLGVVVMAATNRPDVLDPALLRPGRFDRQVTVNLPSLSERIAILDVHSRGKPIVPAVEFEKVARSTPGFSGADLKNLLNEAALWAARRREAAITPEAIEHARDKVVMGLERRSVSLSDEERELLAYHESGHAIVAATLPRADVLRKVTIVPWSRAMGHTEQVPEMDRYIYDREYLLDRLAVMLGGRAAEEIFRQTATSGAESDLKQATRLARSMVLDWGIGERLPSVAFGGDREEVFLGRDLTRRRDYSEATASEVDGEVRSVLNGAFERAKSVLSRDRRAVERLVEELLEREEVPGTEVLEVIGASARGEPTPALSH